VVNTFEDRGVHEKPGIAMTLEAATDKAKSLKPEAGSRTTNSHTYGD
jgi:hypothetical protein